MSWTDSDIAKLRALAATKKFHYTEIAEKLGKTPGACRWQARRLRLPSYPGRHRIGKWNVKHVHLREKAMTYFLTHSFGETAAKFGLSSSELKSLFTAAYRDPQFSHLRKDNRNHSAWTTEDYRFAVQRAGVLPRGSIGQSLKRGQDRVIKEKFKSFNAATKYLVLPTFLCLERV